MTDHRRILLTGATGALGPTVCAELLATDPERQLTVLIRGGDTTVRERFAHWTRQLEDELADRAEAADWRERIRPIEGDLRVEGLILDTALRNELRRKVDCVIHAAADTQFAGAPADQWNTNVGGTRRILEFAHACTRTPKVILVSTVCTSGTRTGRVFESSLLPAPTFVNQYEQTKWEAEQLALADPLHLAIARVSIVLGSHARGTVHRMGALHHLLRWFGRRLVPVMPGDEQTTLDVIATETVGRFIARAVATEWPDKSIWNIAAGDLAPLFSDFCEVCWDQLHPGEAMQNFDEPGEPFIVDQQKFDQVRRSPTGRSKRLSQQAMNSISSFAPMLVYPRTYDTRRAEEVWGGPLPLEDWRQTLSRVLHNFAAPKRQAAAA